MMSYCLKSINTLLGLSNQHQQQEREQQPPSLQSSKNTNHCCLMMEQPHPESLIMNKDDKKKKKVQVEFKGLRFLDGGGTRMSCCTESLGCESSDQIEEEELEEMKELAKLRSSKVKSIRRRHELKKFPPPLTSLNQNGHPSFYLKPDRRDGRLILTQVRINRPEILRASRQDGRLTLHLILPELEPEPEDCESEDVNEPEVIVTEDIEAEHKEEETNEEEEEEEEREDEEQEEEEVTTEQQKLKFPFTSGGGESYRRYNILSNGQRDHSPSFGRCHVMSNHYHHHHHPLWSNNCVTTG